ncbi:uncharacterized protein LOC121554579 isoform X4 [Coregonus clupeaformis]|uniref:uncharacterized protein LOC121554579 isoform X4 n=1 Tax=Coregonus clupeaformis TaxID=59861 RepID=UPI001BDFF2BA|nr:uncharacterized protein LOC121554579 isoform X4 [Coregonus clupeaformis]
MTMENAAHLQSQLTSLMNAVMRAAVVEIVRLVEGSAVVLREELYKSKRENEALKAENDSNKNKLKHLEAKLAAEQRSVGCHVAEAGGDKDEFVHTKDVKACAEKTGAGLQSLESAGQSQATAFKEGEGLKVVAMEKDGIKVLPIKKEINEGTEHDTPSPMTGEQLCPKVDMVYGKEWSQSLWRDGKEKGDNKDRTEEKETPGPSMTQHQKRKRRIVHYADDWIEEEDWIKDEGVPVQTNESIDTSVIPFMADSDLSEYGDGLSTFCSQGNYMDAITESLRGRLGSVRDKQTTRLKTGLLGNTNAKKKQRIIELGWMDFNEKGQEYKQVRTVNGGGTRHLYVDKKKTVEEIKIMAEEMFFPNGLSKKNTQLEDYHREIRWRYSQVNNSSTVEELYEETKVGCLRLYLFTKAHNVRDFGVVVSAYTQSTRCA